MRRNVETEQYKKKPASKQQTFDYSYDTEISILLPYLRLMPITIRSKFMLALKQITEKESISSLNKQHIQKLFSFSDMQTSDFHRNHFLLDIYCRLLKLNKLRDYFSCLSKRSSSRQRQYQSNNQKEYLSVFQPNIQRQISKFQPLNFSINPNYENITKMYKTFTDIHINMDYKKKQLNENYTFFAQPRFLCKLLQMHDIESGFSEKGNIIMLSFQGSKIVGKRGFAFVSNSAIYWWEKNYESVRDIYPEATEEKEKDETKGRKKDNDKQQPKFQQSQPTKAVQNQNFKLGCKLIGHNGKITSLSLSDDQYYLISAGTDRTIKLWCLRQKCLLAQYRGHLKTIWSVSFNKSGYFFLSASADKTIKLWSTDDSIAQRIYVGHLSDVTKVDFLKNPDLIASGSEDRSVKIWNTFTTECIHTFKFDKAPFNFKSSLSGRYFIVLDIQGRINLYDLLKGELINTFRVPEKDVVGNTAIRYLKIHDVSFSVDQKELSCVSGKYIIVYSFEKICEKQSKNIFNDSSKQGAQRAVVTKEVIYIGRDSNLVYCEYQEKGLLVVATTVSKKY